MTLRSRQDGLSLIELMVSMTLGLIVLSGVLVVFVNTSAARNEVERTTRQIENGRYASELLSDDIRLAGFYGRLDPTAGSTSPVVGTPALTDDQCSLAPADWVKFMRLNVFGVDAATLAGTCSLTNYMPNTDVLIVRRVRTCTANATDCTPNVTGGTPYLQVSTCSTQTTTNYVLALYPTAGTAPFDMQTKTCDAATLANKREYFVHIYYIARDNGRGADIPTLKRLELVRDPLNSALAKWDTVPLVEGIENMQFLYGVDSAGNDGVPDEYVADPASIARWSNVVTVQFYILARNIESSPNYTDTKTYTLGKDASGNPITVSGSGGYRRHVYSGLVRLMNPSSRKETP